MRKIVLSLVLLIFIMAASYLIYGTVSKIQKHKLTEERISKLPYFSFVTLNNKSFSSGEIKDGPVLIVRFHPECDHCKYEITNLLKSKIPSHGISIILVSSADRDSISKFLDQFNMDDYPLVIPLVDTSFIFSDIFGSDYVPSNYIYNKEHNLVKAFPGEVKTGTILKYLLLGEQDN
jgi:thiol-disulfide isomerase/thioredoxin